MIKGTIIVVTLFVLIYVVAYVIDAAFDHGAAR